MTRRFVYRCLVIAVLGWSGLGSAACAPQLAPVHQVSAARLTPLSQRPLTAPDVRTIVVRAATSKHWTIQREQPNVVIASVSSAGHSATVRIDYNEAGYSISYADSSPGLKYDGANIHRRYNHWVRLLDEAIQRELTLYDSVRTAGGAVAAPAPSDASSATLPAGPTSPSAPPASAPSVAPAP